MDRVIGVPVHEVGAEVEICAGFVGAGIHRALPFLVHAGPDLPIMATMASVSTPIQRVQPSVETQTQLFGPSIFLNSYLM